MASSAAADCSLSQLKCSSCRKSLGICTSTSDSDSVLIEPEEQSLPEWIQQQISLSGWTKAKLNCPHCKSRIGGLDFVTGKSQYPIRFIKSKVDIAVPAESQTELENILKVRTQAVKEARKSVQEIDSFMCEQESEEDCSSQVSAISSCSSSNSATESQNLSASSSSNQQERPSDSEENERRLPIRGFVSKKKPRTIVIKLKRRKPDKKVVLPTPQQTKQKLIQDIMDAEPELDALDFSLICPVCLDLLFEPHQVDRCKHIFCEPCLRRLGSKNPMNTLCPMCRQDINYCDPLKDFSLKIRKSHYALHAKRKKFECSTNVFNLPLPWRPGWRNLLSGRAMGGNRVANESIFAMFRQLLNQLPYYIPSVVITNLINLLFFLCLLGAVEIMPLLFELMIGKTPSMAGQSPFSRDDIVDVDPVLSHDVPTDTEQMDVETSAPMEDITVASGSIMRDILVASDEDGSSEEIGDAPLDNNNYVTPEASQAMDATLYYVLSMMSLMTAAFGNFLLIHQQPVLEPAQPAGTLLDRVYNYRIFGRHFHLVVAMLFIFLLSAVPILVLPTVLHNVTHSFSDDSSSQDISVGGTHEHSGSMLTTSESS